MEFLEHILGFITDSSKRLSTRATVIILTIACVILIDNLIGFSHYYSKRRQLDQLSSISTLLNDTTLSFETKQYLLELEQQTLKRQNVVEKSIAFLKNITWNSSEQGQNSTSSNSPNTKRNNIWFLISASGLYILATIFVVPVLLLTDKKTPYLKLLASMIIFILIMFFTCWFNYWLFGKIIPDKVFGSWTWNYIINFVLQLGLILGLLFATNTMNKTNTSR